MLVRARTAWLLATWWLGAAPIVSAQVTQGQSTDSLSRAVAAFLAYGLRRISGPGAAVLEPPGVGEAA